ncbi:MAG: efflux RND transporter periplasmic adaptor subunit [Clostridiales bacterium]|jgi:multidrug efflux pump subunit AcrA (membrane-fusion protein)|nr:efflux RND transporter periplasmic adaptor subunit [Clostridiales bacterium]
MKSIIIAVLILMTSAGFIFASHASAQSAKRDAGIREDAVPAELEAAHRENIISKVSAKGTVEFAQKTGIFPRSQAKVKKIHVRADDYVYPGDVLVTYDDSHLLELEDQLGEASLMLKVARTNLEGAQLPLSETEKIQMDAAVVQAQSALNEMQAQIEPLDIAIESLNRKRVAALSLYEQLRTAYISGLVEKKDADVANDALKEIDSQLQTASSQKNAALLSIPAAEENLRLAIKQRDAALNINSDPRLVNQVNGLKIAVEQAELRQRQIRKQIDDFIPEEISTIEGSVISVNVAEGETAAFGRVLMEIADTSPENMKVVVNVPEADAKDMSLGQEALIKGSALGSSVYKAQVSQISSVALKKQIGSSYETVLTVELTPQEPDEKLKAGFSIESEITTEISEGAVVVPLMSTVSEKDGNQYVYVLRPDYTAEKREVSLGGYSGIYVEAFGVADGELVVVNPSSLIMDGASINPSSYVA